jgi:hypothetical protein
MSSLTLRTRSGPSISPDAFGATLRRLRLRLPLSRGALFGAIIVGGLIGFELFNYSTTEFALTDLLGPQRFAGIQWATILALAFCAIDFAGIARLLTPEKGRQDPAEAWYLLGAWFLGATMNAILTWWGVSLALLNHQGLGNEILGRQALLSGVPVFVAVLVWLIRVLMIGTLTLAGERLFSQEHRPAPDRLRLAPTSARPQREAAMAVDGASPHRGTPVAAAMSEAPRPLRPAPKPAQQSMLGQRSLTARPPVRR